MSCDKCDEVQDTGLVAYYRWKNANVGLIGCRDHLLEIFESLNKAQMAERKGEE